MVPSYNYTNDEAGRPVMKVGQKIRRCSFQSMEFLDFDETSKSLAPQCHLL